MTEEYINLVSELRDNLVLGNKTIEKFIADNKDIITQDAIKELCKSIDNNKISINTYNKVIEKIRFK